MNRLTRFYNVIKNFRWAWWTKFMGILQDEVLIPALKSIGTAGKNFIIMKIEEAALTDMSSTDKFAFVYNATREKFDAKTISDDLLTNVVQNLYSTWKIKF